MIPKGHSNLQVEINSQHFGQKRKTHRQPIVHKTQHRTLKTEQHELEVI